jgi:hypothetical protein
VQINTPPLHLFCFTGPAPYPASRVLLTSGRVSSCLVDLSGSRRESIRCFHNSSSFHTRGLVALCRSMDLPAAPSSPSVGLRTSRWLPCHPLKVGRHSQRLHHRPFKVLRPSRDSVVAHSRSPDLPASSLSFTSGRQTSLGLWQLACLSPTIDLVEAFFDYTSARPTYGWHCSLSKGRVSYSTSLDYARSVVLRFDSLSSASTSWHQDPSRSTFDFAHKTGASFSILIPMHPTRPQRCHAFTSLLAKTSPQPLRLHIDRGLERHGYPWVPTDQGLNCP